jgi:DNA repair protein RecN (Recombination protein N)
MLRELSVQNLALIEDVRVELQAGFCAWSGETGAGKSLLLGALGLLLGERGSSDLIRTGTEELRVTGRFDLTDASVRKQIEKILDTTLEDGEILLARRLARSGRSQAYVNDQPVAVATLKQIGSLLVDIHGQRETESLLHPAYQLEMLDAFGGLAAPRQKYLDLAEEVRSARTRFRKLSSDRQQRQRELSLVRFEREELDQARLEPGELPELTRERDRLMNAQSLQQFAGGGYALLYEEEGSVVEQLGRLVREAEVWLRLDPGLEEVVKQLESLQSGVEDVAGTLRDLSDRWEADPERLEEVERRVQLLRRLETKYHKSIDELILYRVSLDEQEMKLQKEEDDLEGIEEELGRLWGDLRKAAGELHKKRASVAKKLASEVQKQLVDLGMADAKLEAILEPVPLGEDSLADDVPSFGTEQLELMLAANPGEPARPLRKVASGGELSRTMLALKTVLAGHDKMGTLVFDEIDANVGGRMGDILGQKLAGLGQRHQVVCVTHLAQVASYARHHWSIRKSKKGSRTVTQIHALADEEARVEELASMMRGDARTESTRQMVVEMLRTARKSW